MSLPTIIATVILVSAIVLYFTDYINLLMSGAHLLIGASGYLLILVAIKHYGSEVLEGPRTTAKTGQRFWVLTATCLILFAIATLLIALNPIRPVAYFMLITVIYITIALQIAQSPSSNLMRSTLLFELIFVHLSLVYSLSLKYYYYFGRVDVLTHVRHTASIAETGQISGIIGIYESFPLWHILSFSQHIIITPGWEIWKTQFILGGITGLIAILGTYSLTKYILPDMEIPFYSALFVSASPTILFYSSYAIPRSAIGSFIVLILLLLIKMKNSRDIILLLILIISAVIYHPATPPFLILIICGLTGLTYLYEPNNSNRLKYYFTIIILSLVLTVAYWTYQSSLVIALMAELFFTSTPDGPIRTVSPQISLFELFDNFYYAPLLTMILIGMKQILNERSKLSAQTVVFSIIGLILLAIIVPGPMALFSKLIGDLSFVRWRLYAYPFVLILASFGFAKIFTNERQPFRIIGIILLILFLIPAIFGSLVAPDNPTIDTDRRTGYLTESEVTAFDSVIEFSDENVYTDYVTSQYFTASDHRDNVRMLKYAENSNSLSDQDGMIIYRQSHASERSILVHDSHGQGIRVTAADLDDQVLRKNKVYSSGSVVALE